MSTKTKGGKKVFVTCECGFEYLKLSEKEHLRTKRHEMILAGTWKEKEKPENVFMYSMP
jgi:hypothetical protein